MTTSTDNLATAEKILDGIRRVGLDETVRIQLAGAYIGLAAIKATIEALRTAMDRDEISFP